MMLQPRALQLRPWVAQTSHIVIRDLSSTQRQGLGIFSWPKGCKMILDTLPSTSRAAIASIQQRDGILRSMSSALICLACLSVYIVYTRRTDSTRMNLRSIWLVRRLRVGFAKPDHGANTLTHFAVPAKSVYISADAQRAFPRYHLATGWSRWF